MLNTSEAPIDLSLYEAQLGVLQTDPNTRTVGSLGRMIAAQQVVGNPFQEFDDRIMGELTSARISDIDVLGTSPDIIVDARALGEATIDDLAFRDSDVSIECEDDIWY